MLSAAISPSPFCSTSYSMQATPKISSPGPPRISQKAKVRSQSYGGEESQHHGFFQGHVETNTKVDAQEKQRGQQGKKQAADNRNGDIIFTQECNS